MEHTADGDHYRELSGGAVGGSRRSCGSSPRCEQPGACLAEVARRHDVSSGLLWNWRRQARRGLLRVDLAPIFLPVQVTGEPLSVDDPASAPSASRFARGCRHQLTVRSRSCWRMAPWFAPDMNVSLATLRRVLAALRG